MTAKKLLLLVCSSFLLAACGGGGGGSVVTSSAGTSQGTSEASSIVTSEATSQSTPIVTSESTPVVTTESSPVVTSESEPVISESTPIVTTESEPVVSESESESKTEETSEDLEYYTITFETFGGSEVAPIKVLFGEYATAPEAPTRGADIFLGWFKDVYAYTPFDFEKTEITADWKLYAGWEEVEVSSSEESHSTGLSSSEEPVSNKTFHLKPGIWDKDGARFAVYLFKGSENTWKDMTKNGSMYDVTLTDADFAAYTSIIFCRMNGSTTENNWNNKWNQSDDLTIGTSRTFEVTDWNSGNWID